MRRFLFEQISRLTSPSNLATPIRKKGVYSNENLVSSLS